MKQTYNLQKWMAAFCIAMTLCIVGNFVVFADECADIRQSVFRLHILANSDEEEDQALKLLVRDAILAESDSLFSDCDDKDAVMAEIAAVLDQIEEIANQTLMENGSDQTATATVQNLYFTTRVYEEYTLPAGFYDALEITIGDGAGQNWWCVLYPALCISSATKQEQIDTALDESQQTIVTSGDYQISFAILEWFAQVGYYLKGEEDVHDITG